ncbi:MAG: TVP38/TMEM64 family protein [Deltaproteobacteria bacterium]
MHLLQSVTHPNLAYIQRYIAEWGSLAPVMVWLAFVVQAMLPIFPYLVVAAGAGALFGFKIGFLVSWLGAVCGCCIGFAVCKYLGADWARNHILYKYDYDLEHITPETAFWTIATALIIPFVPTPVVNAAAGLSGIRFRTFFISVLLGKIPTALLYTGLGVSIFGMRDVRLTLILISCIVVLVALARRYTKGKYDLTGNPIDQDR